MRKIILAAALALLTFTSHADIYQARYGVSETFDFWMYNTDGTLSVSEVDSGTETAVACNEGAETTATNDFVDEGTFYSITLTATEMQCERIVVVVQGTTIGGFIIQTHSNASAMTPQSDANVTQYGGSAGTFASGIPSVNAAQISGDSAAADKLETAFDLTAGPVEPLGVVRQGTAQSATSTTLVLDAAASFADDVPVGMTLVACGSTQGYCQSRPVTDYVLSTDTATVNTWQVTPSGTITYYLFGTAAASGSVTVAAGGITTSSFAAGAIDAAALAADAGTEIGTATWATTTRSLTILDEDSTTMDLNATATGAAASVTGAVGSVTGSVGSVATGGITAASIATDALGAAEIAADAGTELAAAVTSVQGIITGTCDSGSTTTCVDNALTQADALQLEDRLICFDDSWCALISTFTPGTDTAATTKVAPSTRASKAYTIFPSTLE
jgi:hypothetical protein